MQHPGVQGPIRDQLVPALLWNTDEAFVSRLRVDIGEVDLEELHAADLLELFLDAPP
jgi:hypothetical protein